ncbi:DUF4102 domain-containing protein [Nostoc sp. UCD121]|uniref:DUF4102 domain-containing protein n=1 Tax=unclassified Nostoc TaxID=2593658 RepID=UPI001624AE10|nr:MULTISPECIES: DUF4102 domain-containing protein [unclassified Nostoc]MBC1218477.1 DUF4102 domain-containing protein [Nostoc sp. UCD120]MBC1277686.1 DUF4102 domain-containing protein [Nostoc sp. UCD121]MBC1296194.1 DUF4102 domain-containing protein [Nostoc sp. UCD122]
MKHNSDVPGQLALFAIAPTEQRTTVHDPYWDELETAPQQVEDNRWNPADFGEVPRKAGNDGQLTIFYDDTHEPPDSDDYQSVNDYHLAWAEWRIRVGGQVKDDTIETTVETRANGQVRLATKKTAPQHDTHWVEKYWVERATNKYWYFQYCWMSGRKINRLYLGSVDSIIAKRKRADVEIAIADGKLPSDIEKLIRGWKNESPTMPKMQ